MSVLTQISAVTAMNLRNIPQRVGTSSVIIIGIAGVVAVLVSVLAMSIGLSRTLGNSGSPSRAIVFRQGASSELISVIQHDAAMTIADAPGVLHDAKGNSLASAESVMLFNMVRHDGVEASAPVRGVTPQAFAVRPEVKLIAGRMFNSAVNELIVGKAAQRQYKNLELNRQLSLNGAIWTVVGIFESGGDSHESEFMTDHDTLNSAYRRGNSAQTVTVMLESPESFDKFRDSLSTNPTLQVEVKHEREFHEKQGESINKILSIVAYVVGSIMAVGALFGALNAMYTAVSTRSKEIATLRAIGFGALAVVTSVFVEALLLAAIGGFAGAAIAWVLFNGHSVDTRGGGLGGQLIFDLAVTPQLVVLGIIWACVIGALGGLLPAIRAARLPVATALRAT